MKHARARYKFVFLTTSLSNESGFHWQPLKALPSDFWLVPAPSGMGVSRTSIYGPSILTRGCSISVFSLVKANWCSRSTDASRQLQAQTQFTKSRFSIPLPFPIPSWPHFPLRQYFTRINIYIVHNILRQPAIKLYFCKYKMKISSRFI
jgi:hypothetical protein